MIAEHVDGVVLTVRAQAGARRAGVLGQQAGALKLAVTAPPEDGRANQALIELIRDLFGVKRSEVELLTGATARNKAFLLRGLNANSARERLQTLIPKP